MNGREEEDYLEKIKPFMNVVKNTFATKTFSLFVHWYGFTKGGN